MLLTAAAALAGPFQTLHASATLPTQEAEMGGGLGYAAPTVAPDTGWLLISGWARYGLGERAEAFGGAVFGTAGYGIVVHGGARYRLGADAGPQLSAGAGVLSSLSRASPVGFEVPIVAGIAGDVSPFVGGTLIAVPTGVLGTYVAAQGEAGVGFEVESFPVYMSGTYQGLAGIHVVGVAVGMGYNPAQ